VESLQIKCQYGASLSIVSCYTVFFVALAALMPFPVDSSEYYDVFPKQCDTFVDVL